MKFILFIVLYILIFYIYKMFFDNSKTLRSLAKIYLIAFPIGIILYFLVNFIMDEPESFKKGVELLQNNKTIINKIGSFNGYFYNAGDIPKEIDNPALFKVALHGDIGTIYLTCKIEKNSSGNWKLKTIYQDSLVKK